MAMSMAVAAQVRSEAPPPTIWNGGSLTFTKPPGSSDCITAQTCLSRITVLYNTVTGTVSGHQPCPGYTGPSNTEWAYGHITNWATLTYRPLFDTNGCAPTTMVATPLVVHLIAENIYVQIKFNFWNSGSSSFSYSRTTGVAASTATISGRVLAEGGRGIRKANVLLTDQNNVTRTVHADGYGRYVIGGVPAGANYTIGVDTRRFTFTPRSISVAGDLINQDLICQMRP